MNKMAVEAFVAPSKSKITVEKEVRQKPSLAELTTIERPGRPSPASMLEDGKGTRAKKGRKFKKETSDDVDEAPMKKDAILIVTEKPQAAAKIASALGDAKKFGEEGVSYYELTRDGKKILVASAVGHLYNLTYKKGQKGWPIFDVEWVPAYANSKTAGFTKKYYMLIKKLAARAKEVIVATDFDNEGEVIGWNVLRFICKHKNAKRMKYSTLTAPELEKSYDNPMHELAWGNAYAGESRHILDWLYGINLSRALMSAIKTTGSFRILSIGRVQGPALKIIVDREREIMKFKPVPYWQVFAKVDWKSAGVKEPEEEVLFQHSEDIFDKKQLEKFKKIKEGNAKTEKREESIQPPVPFDLTTLQREAYRWIKTSPSETLKIAQQLYLDGLISYPRTSSQKIPKEIEPKKILKMLSKNYPDVKYAIRDVPIEGKKSDPAHPSIFPTGEFAGKLSGPAEKLYNLIVKRFIAAFSSDAKTANKKIVIDSKGIEFHASGLKILDKGWMHVYPSGTEERDLPDLNGNVKIKEIITEEKETQPPSRYSAAGLVGLLEKKNLGTKATRAMIVDTLFNRGYLDGTSIKATQLGIALIEALEEHSPIIIDENLTIQLDEEMTKIEEAKSDFDKMEKGVVDKAKKLITDISKEFKSKEKEIGKALLKGIEEIREEQKINNTLQPCPTCKKGNLRITFNRGSRRYFISCSAYPDCKQTYSLPPNALIKKSGKECPFDHFPMMLALRKGKRPWEFCFNPECKLEKEKREAWEKKKLGKKYEEGEDEEEPKGKNSKEDED
jgi:DNA topoisomerase I